MKCKYNDNSKKINPHLTFFKSSLTNNKELTIIIYYVLHMHSHLRQTIPLILEAFRALLLDLPITYSVCAQLSLHGL